MGDTDGTCNLRYDLLNEDEEQWMIDSFIDEEEQKNNWKQNEKYYWKTKEGQYIKVDDLEPQHIKNIVIYFGKQTLENTGYRNIIKKYKDLEGE